MEKITEGILWYVVFLLSATFHEFSHSMAAFKLGDSTAYDGGHVTLNPVPHIKREPFGTVVVPIFSYLAAGWMIGWASAPYNFKWALEYPKRSAIMSLAGPASNFFLILFAALLIHLGIWLGIFEAPDKITISHIVSASQEGIFTSAATLISILFSLNLILFFFNLIPLPPLDGSGILPLYLKDDTARRYLSFIRNPAFSIVGLLIAWKLFDLIYFHIHLTAINLLYPGMSYH